MDKGFSYFQLVRCSMIFVGCIGCQKVTTDPQDPMKKGPKVDRRLLIRKARTQLLTKERSDGAVAFHQKMSCPYFGGE